jgi:Transposase DDE domain group 1
MQKYSRMFPSVPVSFTGQSLISHAGVSVLTGFMDALGFGRLCEERLGQFVASGARHRPGRLVGSLAAMLAAGGEHASDLDILRSSPGLFGQLPSNATVSRFFERTVTNPELFGGTDINSHGPAHHRHRLDPGDLTLGQGKRRWHLQRRLRIRTVHRLLRLRFRGNPRRRAEAGHRRSEARPVRESHQALKNTGLGRLPFYDFAANQAWANIVS